MGATPKHKFDANPTRSYGARAPAQAVIGWTERDNGLPKKSLAPRLAYCIMRAVELFVSHVESFLKQTLFAMPIWQDLIFNRPCTGPVDPLGVGHSWR